MVLVAIDDASLAGPELAPLPRALFQPVWARLIDGLLDAGARRVAFDVVFAYAGADFKVGQFSCPATTRPWSTRSRGGETGSSSRDFPPFPGWRLPAAVGAARVGVLDLQLEPDGRVRSTAPLLRLPDGRVALGFAALGAGWSVRQAASTERILITPSAPLTDVPTYSLATLLACLSSETGAAEVRKAVEGRTSSCTTVPGEDEHRGRGDFPGVRRHAADGPLRPTQGLSKRPKSDNAPGRSSKSRRSSQRRASGPCRSRRPGCVSAPVLVLALIFALMAFRDESALALGERDVSPASVILVQLARAIAFGPVGPLTLRLHNQRHRAHTRRHLAPDGISHTWSQSQHSQPSWYQISPPPGAVQMLVPNRWPLSAPRAARHTGS